MKLSQPDFQYIKKLAYGSGGLVFEENKAYLIESRLGPLAKKLGCADLGQLIGKVRTGRPTLQRQVLEALTIHETYFFRDSKPFEAMKKHIFPRFQTSSSNKQLNIWCAACSSGQEPYTVAMILRELFNLSQWNIKIIATDISENILAKAKRGIYSQLEVGRGLPPAYQNKYFTHCEEGWQVKDVLKQMIEFRQVNLVGNWSMLPSMDLILMRNVLIYFDNETKKTIFNKIKKTLKPAGYLFLGSSESPVFLDTTFEANDVENAVCYTVKNEKAAVPV